jgi:O-antigen biosynthesis protein
MNADIELRVTPTSQIFVANDQPPGVWLAHGSDPAFDCRWGTGRLPGGWYEVELELEVLRGSIHDPCFYPDYGRGHFVEGEKIVLPLAQARLGRHRVHTLIRFNRDVDRLRFDPSVLPSEFRLTRLTLRRVGRLPAARFMLEELLARTQGVARGQLLGTLAWALLTGGPRSMAERMYEAYATQPTGSQQSDYNIWLDFYEDSSEEALQLASAAVEGLGRRPVFSVIVPVYNPPERWLRACIESVLAQVYPHWELCLADDASPAPHVRAVLEEYARRDPRVKVVIRERNGHISHASNSALDLATGDYVALLDHDDALSPRALLECAKALDAHPRWRMLFSDEDKIDEDGVRSDPYFKSDWNPDLFLSQNCVCHLGVYERALVEQVGRFRPGVEGAQDWDLTLRVSEVLERDQIGHIPKVLYHWRMIKGSTALAPGEKSYAHTAALEALQSHLERTGAGARVEEMPGYSGYYRIAHALPEPAPLVTLMIPTRDGLKLLKQCVDSILRKTDYPSYEILILDNGSREPATLEYFDSLRGHPIVRVEPFDQPFNFSAINNHGARLARGTVLGLVNNDIEVISRGWLREMASHALRPEIGVVGAMLYYPDDRIQHAGVILGIGGVAGHCYVGALRGYPGDKHRAGLVQNLSAVTAACMLVRASVFAEVGGLDEGLMVAFNDVDFCLRVREAGYRNLWTPFAELYHHESASRGYENTPEKIARFKREERFMKERWGRLLEEDPFYNPNFSLEHAPFTLAFPPRSWAGEGVATGAQPRPTTSGGATRG